MRVHTVAPEAFQKWGAGRLWVHKHSETAYGEIPFIIGDGLYTDYGQPPQTDHTK